MAFDNPSLAGLDMIKANDATAQKTLLALQNVDNTSDASKPISTATQIVLDLKATIASPVFTGNPEAPTQAPGDNSTKLATTAYADAAAGGGGISFPFNAGGWQEVLGIVINTTTITLVAYAGCNGTLLGVGEKAAMLGTAGIFAISINGMLVTGLGAVVPTTSGSYTAATAANLFTRGDTIEIIYIGTIGIQFHGISLDYQRTS